MQGKIRICEYLLFIFVTGACPIPPVHSEDCFDEYESERVPRDVCENVIDERLSYRLAYMPCYSNIAQVMWGNLDKSFTNISDHDFVNEKAILKLPFVFDFFEEEVHEVALTKKGTIESTSNVDWIIAPLLADFDANHGSLRYLHNEEGTVFRWENIRLSHDELKEEFSFQVTLYKTGRLDFIYKQIPYDLKQVHKEFNGLKEYFGAGYRHETIYVDANIDEYFLYGYEMDIEEYRLHNWTVITVEPTISCSFLTTCQSCAGNSIQTGPINSLDCSWLPHFKKCVSKEELLEMEEEHWPLLIIPNHSLCPCDGDFCQDVLGIFAGITLLHLVFVALVLIYVSSLVYVRHF